MRLCYLFLAILFEISSILTVSEAVYVTEILGGPLMVVNTFVPTVVIEGEFSFYLAHRFVACFVEVVFLNGRVLQRWINLCLERGHVFYI